MKSALRIACRNLLKVADELESLDLRMQGIQDTLPETVAEADRLLDVEAMDPVMELRAVIACVRNDYIGTAIRDIRDAVAETKGAAGDGEGDPET